MARRRIGQERLAFGSEPVRRGRSLDEVSPDRFYINNGFIQNEHQKFPRRAPHTRPIPR
jgi:hypothetical protein